MVRGDKLLLKNTSSLLVVGDISDEIVQIGENSQFSFDNCEDLLDAIDKAETNHYDIIAVVIPEESAGFKLSLKTLRKATNARVVLLAKMYQEPAAREFVDSFSSEPPLADDYLIYPVELTFPLVTSNIPAENTNKNLRIEYLEKLATEDDLTGLKNRRYIFEFTRQIIERAGKTNKRVTLLLFDIDNFKQYNDNFGHGTGDEILRQAAVLMKRCCRGHDVVGRIGGDEFAVVFWDDSGVDFSNHYREKIQNHSTLNHDRRLAGAEHPTEAVYMAQRLAVCLQETNLTALNGLGLHGKGTLTISGGLASFPRDASTAEELFMQADKALLDAKRNGKNRIYLVGSPGSDTNQ